MTFFAVAIRTLRRYFLDVIKVSTSYGRHFLTAVFFLFVSEVLKVISFIIPLKIILLLSADKIPSSLSSYMVFGTLHEWVLFLAFMTVLTYVVSVLCYFLAKKATRKGAGVVKEKRLQEEKSWNAKKSREIMTFYKLYSESVADFILAAVCFCAIMVTNLKVGFLIMVICFGVLSLLSIVYKIDRMNSLLLGDKSKFLVQYLCQSCFFFVFIFMVIDYLFWSPINPIIAMITLIVARRFVSAIERFLKKLARLNLLNERAARALRLER